MTRLCFDLETDGLLPDVSTIHCLVTKDIDSGETKRYRCNSADNSIADGIRSLQSADLIIGHNIIKYDVAVLNKLHNFTKPIENIFDTLVATRLIYTNLYDRDMVNVHRKRFPVKYVDRQSLKAWGFRMGILKDDYEAGWEAWSQELEDYCVQDVEVTHALFTLIESKRYDPHALSLEHLVADIMYQQEVHGWRFDGEKAVVLYAKLKERQLTLTADLQQVFAPWRVKVKTLVPKVNNKARGYVKGVPVDIYKTVSFNPASRDHIGDRLMKVYGWSPKVYTNSGKPQIDEEIIKTLPYPEIPLLTEYLMISKRIGQLAEGKEAWMTHVQLDGRIHGQVKTNGAVTGRMTHSKPNMAQVPRGNAPYGKECRSLFIVPEGYKLVGVDASGLELRCLAHYLSHYDNGEYINVVTTGDVHTFNQQAGGMTTRDIAKRWIYAWLYGAGDAMLGQIAGVGVGKAAKIRKQFLANIPAVAELKEGIEAKIVKQKYLKGLDGRQLHIRSMHSALNTLLQSAGAVIMKQALVILNSTLKASSADYHFVGNIHDEFQIEVLEKDAQFVGECAVDSIRLAGEALGVKCPLTGEFKIGNNWSETH